MIFGAFMWTKGADPLDAYRSMWESLTTDTSLTGILTKGTPLILAALAVAVPARAGLVNVGGEGQLIMGGVGRHGGVAGLRRSHLRRGHDRPDDRGVDARRGAVGGDRRRC